MAIPFIVFIIWPIAELYVAVKIAEAIGVLAMLALLVVAWPAGTWVLRTQGVRAWRRFTAAVLRGRTPGHEAIDGALVLLGGILLLVPGFITDGAGLLLLLAPSRALLRGLISRNFRSPVVVRAARFTSARMNYDVESTAHDVTEPRLRP
jgi:UPF0716 protein FxsA